MRDRERLSCPHCEDIGPVRKVTAIVHEGRSRVGVGGLQIGSVGVGTAETELARKLAEPERPAEPSEPLKPNTAPLVSGAGCLGMLAVLALGFFGVCSAGAGGLGLLLFAVSPPRRFDDSIDTGLIFAMVVLFAFGIILISAARRVRDVVVEPAAKREASLKAEAARRDEEQYEKLKARYAEDRAEWVRSMAKWGDATDRWNRLYYCSRCDVVFLLDEAVCAPIDDLRAILYP